GAVLARVEPCDGDAPGEVPSVEVRHEATRGAQERRLAAAGEAREHAELACAELEVDVVERRLASSGVTVGDMLEGEQRATHGCIPRREAKGRSVAALSASASATVARCSGRSIVGYA